MIEMPNRRWFRIGQLTLSALVAVAASGCGGETAVPAKIASSADPSTGIKPGDPVTILPDEAISEDDAKHAIEVARKHLEDEWGKSIDGDFSAVRTTEGYSVLVEFIVRDKQGRPGYFPGGHCVIQISKDWKVVDVLKGY